MRQRVDKSKSTNIHYFISDSMLTNFRLRQFSFCVKIYLYIAQRWNAIDDRYGFGYAHTIFKWIRFRSLMSARSFLLLSLSILAIGISSNTSSSAKSNRFGTFISFLLYINFGVLWFARPLYSGIKVIAKLTIAFRFRRKTVVYFACLFLF